MHIAENVWKEIIKEVDGNGDGQVYIVISI